MDLVNAQHDGPIGVFDSGLGGLSVLRHLVRDLPRESFVYVADSARAPYGARSAAEVTAFSEEIVTWLVERQGCKLIVVACNTATAASAKTLRTRFPAVPVVGMEPAVKPAARATRTGVVGVMATAGTIASEKYAALLRAYGEGLTLVEDPCVGLVQLIEDGHLDDELLRQRLRDIIAPMLAQQVDTIVLGCTHFPLVEASIREIAGPDVTVAADGEQRVELFTTGDVGAFRQNVGRVLGAGFDAYCARCPTTVPVRL